MERAVAGSADDIGRDDHSRTDLTFRHLVDRDDLSASAALVLNRISREGPMRLTALAAAEGASQSGMTQLVQRMEPRGCWSDGVIPMTAELRWSCWRGRPEFWDARGTSSGSESPRC